MKLEQALLEMFLRSAEGREVFIKIVAFNRQRGLLVYTTYGSVKCITRDRIYFDYKRTAKGQEPLVEGGKDYECYIKSDFDYDITFLENFDKEDYCKLIDLTLSETFPIPIYTAFKSFLINNTK